MAKYLVNYTFPKEVRGSYFVDANDSLEASNKVEKYITKKYGEIKDSYSTVTEIYKDNFNVK